MKKLILGAAFVAILFTGPIASAQDAGRAAWRPSDGSFGLNCAVGENTTVRSNIMQCSNTIANSTNATTAATATVATQAQSLNPSAQVNASQISGVIAAGNLPSGSGSGGVTCTGAPMPSTGRSGTFSVVVGGYANVYSAGTTGSVSGTYPSLGSGQSTSFPISGSASDSHNGVTVSVSGSATATCSSTGTVSFSNFSWSGNWDNGGGVNYMASGS